MSDKQKDRWAEYPSDVRRIAVAYQTETGVDLQNDREAVREFLVSQRLLYDDVTDSDIDHIQRMLRLEQPNPSKNMSQELARMITTQKLNLKSITAIKGFAESEGMIGVTREIAALAKALVEKEYKRRAESLSDSDTKDKENTAEMVSAIATELIENNHFLSDKTNRGYIHRYNPDIGIWDKEGEPFIRHHVATETKDNYRHHVVNEVVHAVKEQTIDFKERLYDQRSPEVLVVENGKIDLDTEEFSEEFSPEDYQIVAVPVKYDPFATCPEFDTFLDQVLENEDCKLAIYELMGYCLYKGWPFDILVIMIGSGGNGKSVLFDVICSFLGQDNVTSITLHALDPGNNRFASSDLYGKLANIAGEISDKRISSTAHIKDLTGGGLIAAERKHMDRFLFKNFAKMIFSTNTPPPISDRSRAMWRRLYHFRFPNTFVEGENAIPRNELLDKLTTPEEMSGVLNQAIAGWKRLKENGGVLTGSPSEEERELKYLIVSDPIAYMVKRYLYQEAPTPSEGKHIKKNGLYDIYVRQCHLIQEREGIKIRVSNKSWFHQLFQREATWTFERQIDTYPPDRKNKEKAKKERVYEDLGIDFNVLREEGIDISDIDLVVPTSQLTEEDQSTVMEHVSQPVIKTSSDGSLLSWLSEKPDGEKFIMSMKEYNDYGAEALRRNLIEKLKGSEYRKVIRE